MKKQIAFITAVCLIIFSMLSEFQSFAEENIHVDTQSGVSPVKLTGRKSFNLDANDYPIRSSCMHYNDTVNSYLLEKDNNTLERVEYCLDTNEIIAENYSNDGNQLFFSKNIKMELTLFGGFFSGTDFNYFVFGDVNENDDDSREIIRIVKYSKDWIRISSCSLCGLDTYIPFDRGSLDMAEAEGTLFIHTCHKMYNGYQENISIAVDENTMKMIDLDYHNEKSIRGTVYHSTGSVDNHLVRADSSNVFRLTHESLVPVGFTISKSFPDVSFKSNKTVTAVDLSKSGNTNTSNTGASVGGFEITEDNCLIAFNSVEYKTTGFNPSGVRNVYFMIVDRKLTTTRRIRLTNYSDNSDIKVSTPQMVKINNNNFLLLWEEFNHNERTAFTKMVLIDSSGKIDSQGIVTTNYCLSDCHPILCSDNLVRWYAGMDESPVLYTVDPFSLKLSKETVPQNLDLEHSISLQLGETFTIPFFNEPRVEGRGWSGTTEFMRCINDDFSFTATNYCYGSLQPKLEHRTIIYNITVGNPVTSLKLNTGKLDLRVNEKEKLIATVMPSDATFKSVTWESSNPDVATVRAGIVTGLSKGSATITVTSTNGLKAKCVVDVEMFDELSSIGDVNGDEIVNVKDRIYLSRHLASWTGYEIINRKSADLNCDGAIDVKDRIILTRYLAKWDKYMEIPFKT